MRVSPGEAMLALQISAKPDLISTRSSAALPQSLRDHDIPNVSLTFTVIPGLRPSVVATSFVIYYNSEKHWYPGEKLEKGNKMMNE